MNQKVRDRQMSIAEDFVSTILKDIGQLRQQEPSASLPAPPLEWNLSTPLHTADAIFLMEPNGNISLSLTVRHKH